jgi:hypothetical protein
MFWGEQRPSDDTRHRGAALFLYFRHPSQTLTMRRKSNRSGNWTKSKDLEQTSFERRSETRLQKSNFRENHEHSEKECE